MSWSATQDRFFSAVRTGDAEAVAAAIREAPRLLDAPSDLGASALHVAAKHGSPCWTCSSRPASRWTSGVASGTGRSGTG